MSNSISRQVSSCQLSRGDLTLAARSAALRSSEAEWLGSNVLSIEYVLPFGLPNLPHLPCLHKLQALTYHAGFVIAFCGT